MAQCIGLSAIGIEEVEGIASVSLPEEFTTGVHISVRHTVDGFTCADAVGVVGVAYVRRAIRSGSKLSAILPSERPASAVVVTQGITNGIVGDGFIVVSRQQVFPIRVAVRIGVAVRRQDVTHRVVGVAVGRGAVDSGKGLSLCIVGIGDRSVMLKLGLAQCQINAKGTAMSRPYAIYVALRRSSASASWHQPFVLRTRGSNCSHGKKAKIKDVAMW